MNLLTGKISLMILVLCTVTSANDDRGTYLNDSSDWWSLQRRDGYDIKVKPGNVEIDEGSFSIGSLSLRHSLPDWMAKSGKTAKVSRGDGAIFRSQICYESTKKRPTQHLIRESGEITESFIFLRADNRGREQNFCTETSVAK